MKKISKMLLSTMACMMLVVCLPMITKAAPTTSSEINESAVYGMTSLYVGNLEKSTKITAVKSSNPAVAEYVRVVKYHDLNESNPSDGDGYRSDRYYADIYLRINKVGTTTVSYKIDGKKYTTKFVVKPYRNCIDTMTVSGINSGKNIAGSFSKQNITYKKLSKDLSNLKISIKLKSGCTFGNIYLHNGTTNTHYSSSFSSVNKKTVTFGSIKKTDKAYMEFYIYDAKNKVSYSSYLYINNN